MGLYRLTNIPKSGNGMEIRGIVRDENIIIAAARRDAAPNDYAIMGTTMVGDHMLARGDDLRRMVAADLVAAISAARDAGYEQARADIRYALGIRE